MRWTRFVGALVLSGGLVAAGGARAGDPKGNAAEAGYDSKAGHAHGKAKKLTTAKETLMRLHEVCTMELESARLAQQKAQSPMVREFAQVLERDHQKLMMDVQQTAQKSKVKLDTTTTTAATTTGGDGLSQLQGVQGQAFDQAFLQMQADAHKQVISDLKDAETRGLDKRVKELVQTAIPQMEKHQQMAQILHPQLGVTSDTEAAPSPGTTQPARRSTSPVEDVGTQPSNGTGTQPTDRTQPRTPGDMGGEGTMPSPGSTTGPGGMDPGSPSGTTGSPSGTPAGSRGGGGMGR